MILHYLHRIIVLVFLFFLNFRLPLGNSALTVAREDQPGWLHTREIFSAVNISWKRIWEVSFSFLFLIILSILYWTSYDITISFSLDDYRCILVLVLVVLSSGIISWFKASYGGVQSFLWHSWARSLILTGENYYDAVWVCTVQWTKDMNPDLGIAANLAQLGELRVVTWNDRLQV